MKNLFQEPEMNILNLAVEDIIMSSPGLNLGDNETPGDPL